MSLYWDVPDGTPEIPCTVRYRAKGETVWRAAQNLWFDKKSKQYRGSVVRLTPDTEYEFSLRAGEDAKSSVSALTWSDRFPIAQTTVLPAGVIKAPLVITEGGTADGYRLYTAAPEGTTIDAADAAETCVRIEADYVILRGVTCRGAQKHGILIANRHDIVIEGCDVSGWGRRDAQAGNGGVIADLGAHLDSAIASEGREVERVVIQGNRLHHPRWRSNNWTELAGSAFPGSTHPQGPKAVTFFPPTRGRHVIRWNACHSDAAHMFNDILLESDGSSATAGNGLTRDSDIYGNDLADAWDDAIEAERGDENVRIWGNHFSNVVKCISAGYIWRGPLYAFGNVAERLPDPNAMPAHNGGHSPFKAHPPCFMAPPQEDPAEKRDGVVYVYHNTLLADAERGAGWAFNAWWKHRYVSATPRLVSRNNLWMTRPYPAYWNTQNLDGVNYCVRDFDPSYFDQDYDLHDGVISPASAADPHTRRAEPVFRAGQGPGKTGRYQLAPGTPGCDDGTVLANFSDSALGQGPDRGAHESGAPDLRFGPELWTSRRSTESAQ